MNYDLGTLYIERLELILDLAIGSGLSRVKVE